MKKLLLLFIICCVHIFSFAEVIDPSGKLVGKYINIKSNSRGALLNNSNLTVLRYDNLNEGDLISYRTYGNNGVTNVAMAAAWYSSSALSTETYIAPALFTDDNPMATCDADGTYALIVPQGATTLAVTISRYYGTGMIAPTGSPFVHSPSEYISGSLPVMYITTTDSVPITSKDYYLEGTYYLDNMGHDGFESIGSLEEQLPLQIKGRGNSSWRLEKKPYRIKLDNKQALLGMKKSKHFCLMAHHEDGTAFQADEMGFTFSQLLGMDWTPHQEPIELVLNGDYMGLYWVTEKIRVESGRVDIVEQADEETNPELVTGGWLIEISNKTEEGQISFEDGAGEQIRFSLESPEILSDVQSDYIYTYLTTVDSLIYINNKYDNAWEEYIDIDELVKFYVLQELIDNCEAFSGSCYMHKDLGDATKFRFGPVWDFGSIGTHYLADSYNYFIYEATPAYVTNHWISEIAKFPHFQEKVRQLWSEIYPEITVQAKQHCLEYVDYITPAIASNYMRWKDSKSTNIDSRKNSAWNTLQKKWNFLDSQWSNPIISIPGDVNGDGNVTAADITALYNFLLNGDETYISTSDVNGDGTITSADITAVYNILLEN